MTDRETERERESERERERERERGGGGSYLINICLEILHALICLIYFLLSATTKM